MPKVDLIATRDFTYATRRLQAGDAFQARNRDDAKILIELLGKARIGRPPATVAPPPAEVAEKAKAAAKPQLDHDGNGKPGGSTKGRRKRKTAAKK